MPKLPINYSNTHFYKIVCKNADIKDCYVGHTTDFKRRKANIRSTAIWKHVKVITIYPCIGLLEKMEVGIIGT